MIRINAIMFDGLSVKTIRGYEVTEENNLIVKKNQEFIKEKIKNKIKEYKKAGIIKSIKRPINKRMQSHLNELIIAKRETYKSINIIRKVYKW